MSVTTADLKDGAPVKGRGGLLLRLRTGDGASGALAWVVGALATGGALGSLLPTLPWYFALGFAVLTQGVLTVAQRRIWRGKPSMVSLGALGVDVLLNAGGLYPYALRLGATPPVQMIADVAGAPSEVGPLSAMIVAVALGFLIAAAPEELLFRGKE